MFGKIIKTLLLVLGLLIVTIVVILFMNRNWQFAQQPGATNRKNKPYTMTEIHIVNEFGKVTLGIAPIPGVTSATSEFINIHDGIFDRQYHAVPWLTKSDDQPVGLKEYVDPQLKVRFLYPADRGKLRWDVNNKEFIIDGSYRIDDQTLPSFLINFSETIAMIEIDGNGPTSPSNFCAKRLASDVPLLRVEGCFMRSEKNGGIMLIAIVHSWENDAGYEVVEANAELIDHPKFKSVSVQLQYSDFDTDTNSQILLYILDSIREVQ